MSDETSASEGGAETSVVTLGADAPASFDSPQAAVDALLAARNEPAESADDATADNESPDEGDAAPPEEATGETQEDNPAEKSPLDLPRSWTKEQSEHWTKLDRATQEYLLEHDKKVSDGVRRSQNEAAEARKAAEAVQKAAEEARQKYESQLPALMQALQDAKSGEFSDIKSVEDVAKLASEDPFRFQQWQVHQMRLQAVDAQLKEADSRKSQEEASKWAEYVQKENNLAHERIPELADKEKGPALAKRAADRLSDLGFSQDELNKLASGKEKISLYDHRLQQLIFSDLKLQDIQSAPKAVVKPNLPPVQRPGVAQPAGAARAASLQTLSEKLSSSGNEKDAFELLLARRAASNRRAS